MGTELSSRITSSIALPAVSFVLSMLCLFIANRGKPGVAFAACALPPLALWLFTPVLAVAFYGGIIPAGVLLVGLLMWCSPTRSLSATKALTRSALCGLPLSAASFYVFIATDCIHTTNGGRDEPAILWGSAVACSWPIGTVVSAAISTSRDRSLPWER